MAQPGTGALGGGQRIWRVLVVDDEENLNWSLVTSLRREQYAADGALTAEDARRRMVDVAYDCVISDIQMPGIDGFQLMTWLRENRPQSRVIMMTAFGSPSVRQEALRIGVAAYLEKPFDLNALKLELRRALEAPAQSPVSYDLIEITQVINLARRDVSVQAQVNDQLGMLVFERGELISAVFGALRGELAFFALCATPAQLATPAPTPERVERNVTQAVSALIFDALLKRDTGLASGRPSPVAPSAQPGAPVSGEPALPQRAGPTPPRPTALPATGPLPIATAATTPFPAQEAQRLLAALVTTLARPCSVALLTPDGAIRGLAHNRVTPIPEPAFALISQGFAAFARAAQIGQMGAPRETRWIASGEQALLRLIGARPGAPALVVIVSAEADPRQIDAAVATHETALRELLG